MATTLIWQVEVPEKKSGGPQMDGGGNQYPMNEISNLRDLEPH